MTAVTGRLELEVEPGVTLSDRTDIGLAGQWARHACGSRWDELTTTEQHVYIAEALRELRRVATPNGRDRP